MNKILLWVLLICIISLACTFTVPPMQNKARLGFSPLPLPAPVPHTGIEMKVCNSGGLSVRETPSADGKHTGKWKQDGDFVIILPSPTVSEDMGLWYELAEGGFVNARYICKK